MTDKTNGRDGDGPSKVVPFGAPTDENQEPPHFDYVFTFTDKEFLDPVNGYMIVTPTFAAVADEGYIKYAAPWSALRGVGAV